MQVGIILYPGNSKNHLDYFTFFLDANGIKYEINHCYLGHKLVILQNNKIDIVVSHICSFIFEFYLKEAVISKIYDEYPLFNTEDASFILADVSNKFLDTPIKDDIKLIIKNKYVFNPESYFLFNMKPIMICIYALTDEVGKTLALSREKDKLISMIKTFSDLSFEKCQLADVEFSLDDKCIVSFDKMKSEEVSSKELLSLLTQKSPRNVNIKNAGIFPELADVIEQIFNSQKI